MSSIRSRGYAVLIAALLSAGCSLSPAHRDPLRTVTVVLEDSLGVPFEGARVIATSARAREETRWADTDAAGKAAFTLPAAPTLIEVMVDGLSKLPPGRAAGMRLEVPPPHGADTTLIHLVHHTSSHVTGRVRWSSGAAVARASLYRRGDLRLLAVSTDSLGTFMIDQVPLGAWEIEISPPSGGASLVRPVVVTSPGSTVTMPDIVLTP